MQEFDVTTPNVARMYDYYLGGKDNFAADRDAADKILRLSLQARLAAQQNREWLKRAVQYAARSGISQFIDIGAGLPTMENTHEIAAKENWLARVVYVDNDPVVVNHGTALLAPDEQAVVVGGDLRDPRQIMGNTVLRSFIDTSKPTAVILAAVLHFIADDLAYEITGYLRDTLAGGSALIISHATADDATPEEIDTVTSVYNRTTTPIRLRSRDAIERFFSGFDLAEPGVVDINAWRPAGTPSNGQTIGYGGVAVKRTRTPSAPRILAKRG
jgi:hypothetical protein